MYIYIYLSTNIHQEGSKCEHPRMQRQMWVGSAWFKSQCICGLTNIHLWTHVCIQRASKCERSHGHWRMWVRTTRVRIQRIYDTSSTAQDGGGSFQNRTPIVVSFSLTLMQIHLLLWHVVCIILYYVPSGGWRPHQEPSAEKEPRNPRGMQRESFQSPPVAGRCPSLLGEQKPVVWNWIFDQHFDGTAMWGWRNLTCKYWFIPRIWCSHFACCVCMFLIFSRSVFLCANELSTKPPTSWKTRRFPDDNYMFEAKTCTVDDVARAQAKIREEPVQHVRFSSINVHFLGGQFFVCNFALVYFSDLVWATGTQRL